MLSCMCRQNASTNAAIWAPQGLARSCSICIGGKNTATVVNQQAALVAMHSVPV